MTEHGTRSEIGVGALAGQVALVTGSSRGIGAAIAKLFASEGALVVVHGRDEHAVAGVTADIEHQSGIALPVPCDLTSSDEIEEMRALIEQHFGPIDVLVANAGGSTVGPGPLEEITEEQWHESVDANLTATFLTMKAFLPGMKERGRGTIITLSSAASRRPTARSPIAYAAAKAAIEVLTKSVALDGGPFGLRANCIAPETILTERNAERIPGDVQEQLRLAHPIQRLGTPWDVAHAALYLASEQSSWVTGITLDVAGGSVLV